MLLLFIGPPSPALTVEGGDREFALLNYPQAETCYDSALTMAADSADVLWRLARVTVCTADIAPDEQKLQLYRKADAYAYRCIRADSMVSEGHTWRAAALGNIAMFEGGKTKVSLCYVIQHELELSIALNPHDDVAYSILGSFYMALGNVSWVERQLAALFFDRLPEGGFEESEQSLKKAITISPNVIRHHFELGRLYMLEDRREEALKEFQIVATLPVLLGRDQSTQARAAGLIKEIAEK